MKERGRERVIKGKEEISIKINIYIFLIRVKRDPFCVFLLFIAIIIIIIENSF